MPYNDTVTDREEHTLVDQTEALHPTGTKHDLISNALKTHMGTY